ncbi:somatostatin-2 isoform X1 [Rana temporaria]|uniref:somatostatin-2 isoform X1 n=1 Tax=Rana temporaria TaxID=8407 RepID=UPI001AAC9B4E|nr:somatostatin-2 isoform X1 [Rana temporaria]
MLGSAGSLLLLLLAWGARALSQPDDNRITLGRNQVRDATSNQDLNAIQEDLLLKLLSGWTDSRESNLVEVERSVPDPPEPKIAQPVKFPRLSLRERKAPCKNFFWKTFTMC